jgi:hypothetical protein
MAQSKVKEDELATLCFCGDKIVPDGYGEWVHYLFGFPYQCPSSSKRDRVQFATPNPGGSRSRKNQAGHKARSSARRSEKRVREGIHSEG